MLYIIILCWWCFAEIKEKDYVLFIGGSGGELRGVLGDRGKRFKEIVVIGYRVIRDWEKESFREFLVILVRVISW